MKSSSSYLEIYSMALNRASWKLRTTQGEIESLEYDSWCEI